MKLIGSTKNKITKDKNGENIPHLGITEVVLVIAILLIMIFNKIQEPCTHLFQINCLVVYEKFLQQIFVHLKTFNSEFQTIELWSTDQNSQPLETEERINSTD